MKKSKKSQYISMFLLLAAFLAISGFVVFSVGRAVTSHYKEKPYVEMQQKNLEALENEISKTQDSDIVSLNDLAPFEWDTFYVFGPYSVNYEGFSDMVGGDMTGLDFAEPLYDSSSCAAFYKDGKPVCGVFGRENYQFVFDWDENNYNKVIHPEDGCELLIHKSNTAGGIFTRLEFIDDNTENTNENSSTES